MDTREVVILAAGAVLLASSLVFQVLNLFGVSYQALGGYTGVLTQTGYTVLRVALTLAGAFLVVLGWRRMTGEGGFTSEFGKPFEKSKGRFWTEVALGEAFGLVIVWAVFVVTQSPFYYLPGFPLSQFEVAGELVLFVGGFLIARSTFAILAEVLR